MSTTPEPPEQDESDHRQAAWEALARATLALGIRSSWEVANRRGLLWAHALWSLWIGTQIVLYGGPGNVEHTFGVWTRPTLGATAITGAVLLCSGLSGWPGRTRSIVEQARGRRPRSVPREIAGLIVLGLWDAAMFGGILAARIQQGSFAPRPLMQPQAVGYVVGYPVGVYGLLLTLILIHLWTLARLVPPGGFTSRLKRGAAWTLRRSPRP